MLTTTALTTLSSFLRLIPLTPLVALPMSLMPFSLNLMEIPFLVTIVISLSPSVILTLFKLSPSSIFMAIIPPLRGLLKAERAVFLTIPFSVTIISLLPSSKSATLISAAICSSPFSSSRFTIALPLERRPPSGIS